MTSRPAWSGRGSEAPQVVKGSAWNAADLATALSRVCDRLQAEQAELGRLDGLAGDGDLGVTLARGFAAVVESVGEASPERPGDVLKVVATTLSTKAPSTMGTLLATAFKEAATALGERDHLGRLELISMLDAAANGVARRGDVEGGERTVLDAMLPALETVRATTEDVDIRSAFAAAAKGAAEGAEATRQMEPQVGRASWVGARVIGTPDGGAVAWSLILDAMAGGPGVADMST